FAAFGIFELSNANHEGVHVKGLDDVIFRAKLNGSLGDLFLIYGRKHYAYRLFKAVGVFLQFLTNPKPVKAWHYAVADSYIPLKLPDFVERVYTVVSRGDDLYILLFIEICADYVAEVLVVIGKQQSDFSLIQSDPSRE